MFIAVQDWSAFKAAQKVLCDGIFAAQLFVSDQGTVRESHWAPIAETVLIREKHWQVRRFNYVIGVPLPGTNTEVFATAIRLVCPHSLKSVIQSEATKAANAQSDGYRSALAEYSTIVMSPPPELATFLVQVSAFFEAQYPRNDYLFVPTTSYCGLLPHFDFDVVVPYISAASLRR
jgi:hypothetical protein